MFTVLLAIVATFTGGDMTKVQVKIKNEVTTQSEKIVFEISNYTGKTIGASNYFTLEIGENGEWTEVEQVGEVTDIAYLIKNLRSMELSIDIVHTFGKNLTPANTVFQWITVPGLPGLLPLT